MKMTEFEIALVNEDEEQAEKSVASFDLDKIVGFYPHSGALVVNGCGICPATVVLVNGTDGFIVLEKYDDFKNRFFSVNN